MFYSEALVHFAPESTPAISVKNKEKARRVHHSSNKWHNTLSKIRKILVCSISWMDDWWGLLQLFSPVIFWRKKLVFPKHLELFLFQGKREHIAYFFTRSSRSFNKSWAVDNQEDSPETQANTGPSKVTSILFLSYFKKVFSPWYHSSHNWLFPF